MLDFPPVDQALAIDTDGVFAKAFEGRSRTVEDASKAIVKIVDGSTREKEGGEFLNVDGTKLPW